jgi:hypothetical protein
MWFGRHYDLFGYRIVVGSGSLLHGVWLSLDDGKSAGQAPPLNVCLCKKEMKGPSGVLTEAQGTSRRV